jgi:ABC-type sugar transport system substrate-binding protein
MRLGAVLVLSAVLTRNQTNPFFQAERIGAAKAAASLHAKAPPYVPTQADSISSCPSSAPTIAPSPKKPARR